MIAMAIYGLAVSGGALLLLGLFAWVTRDMD